MMDAKGSNPRHIMIKRPKLEDKERLLNVAREKKLVTRWLPDGREEGENR